MLTPRMRCWLFTVMAAAGLLYKLTLDLVPHK